MNDFDRLNVLVDETFRRLGRQRRAMVLLSLAVILLVGALWFTARRTTVTVVAPQGCAMSASLVHFRKIWRV